MAGRISEYLTLSKVLGTELVDVSAVDAASPTGYTTLKTTVQELADFNPSIYTASSELTGDRTVSQLNNKMFFDGGDFGLDFANKGFFYEDLTRRIGIGTDSPSSSLHIKGQSGDNFINLESSTGIEVLNVRNSGKVGINNASPSGTLHIKSLDGFGNILEGNSNNSSEYILRLLNSAGTEVCRFRNSGRVDLGANGSQVVVGNSGGTNYQFHQWSGTSPGSSLPIHVVQAGSNVRFMVRANGGVSMGGLPTSTAGLVAGDIWNDGGTLKIV